MTRAFKSALAVALVTLVATALPRTALASGPWNPDCPNVAGSNVVCIYSDTHWTGQIANEAFDNTSYQGENYPSSDTHVEDTVSSTKNLFGNLRVKWWEGRNYSGWSLCNQANEGFYSLGIWWNDALSSHDITGAAC